MARDDDDAPDSETEVDDTDPCADDTSEEPQETETDRTGKVLQLLPVHAAPTLGGKGKGGNALKVERQRGRPRKVERMPTTSDLQYHALISEQKAKFIDADPVVGATVGRVDSVGVLKLIRAEIAKESAALHFQRVENEKYGKDTSQTSTRRIDALTKIANIELEIKKLGTDVVDLHGDQIQKILGLWIELMREAAADTLSAEQIDLFFNRFSTKMEGWQDRANDILR